MPKKVLVIEDEMHIIELLRYNITAAGYDFYYAENGKSGLDICLNENIDLLILDLMLPDIDGMDLCKKIKNNEKTKNVPIIMLTAKSDEFDKVLGLELGADDYITKPFSIRELMARIKAVLRRSGDNVQKQEDDNIIKIKDITINKDSYQITKNGEVLDLTLKEFELLRLLIENKGKVLTRDFLLDKIWGYDFAGETRTVDVHIRHLREKLGDNDAQYIETVRGIGYKFLE